MSVDYLTGELLQLFVKSAAAQVVTIILAMITGLKYIKKQSDNKRIKELTDLEEKFCKQIKDVDKDIKNELASLKQQLEAMRGNVDVTTRYIDSAIDNINERLNIRNHRSNNG